MPLIRISATKENAAVVSDSFLHSLRKTFAAIHQVAEDAYQVLLTTPQAVLLPRTMPMKTCFIVEITLLPGRSHTVKRETYEGLCALCVDAGIPRNDVSVVFLETGTDNWFSARIDS
ncbi:MAG: tautomerase family protein [Rhodospirillaceae bacterium]|nr:tautomerase family protein [Rhodospirillaceae bacterium]